MDMRPADKLHPVVNAIVWVVMWGFVVLTLLGILFGATGPGDTGRW